MAYRRPTLPTIQALPEGYTSVLVTAYFIRLSLMFCDIKIVGYDLRSSIPRSLLARKSYEGRSSQNTPS